ncbi:MAG: polysaccharide deacetylase family protein [Oscillospiraceae bacterium]|nr:polysaccharide deacetylase family protein [Oscillospiraceae bacterium]
MGSFKNQAKLKAVTFSFDDGVTQDIRMIELLNRYKLKATFNLNSELLGEPRVMLQQNQRISHYKVSPKEVKYIYEGHEVAAHTLNHPNLTKLDEAEIIRQVEKDRENLKELVGYEIMGMAYPCGGINHDERVAGIIRERTKIKYCRTIVNTDSFGLQKDLYRLNPNVRHREWERAESMAKSFIEMTPEEPQVFFIWGHSYEMDFDSSNWARLEDFFRLISNRDDIFYGTNAEVFL